MTIKELEERLGLPRASIRFYEQEGFIRPARGANNYRDYSEADLATLEKVKLLRQLGLSLEDIRKAQTGERPLSALLAAQEAALERQRAGLAWAENVCRAMREDGAEFATLDPEKYLHAPDRPAEGGFSLEGDVLPKMAYPWRRFFARWLDLNLYALFWTAFGLLVLRFNPPDNLLFSLLASYRDYATMLLVEPILLHFWGWTPGKWLLGLRLRDGAGEKLSWSAALSRTLGVFVRGYGYGIPIYSLYRHYKSYRACADCEALPWEEEERYTLRDSRGWRGFAYVGVVAAVLFLAVLTTFQSYMPRHRAPLTPEAYIDNVNDMYRYAARERWDLLDREGNYALDWLDSGLGGGLLWDGGLDHALTLDGAGTVTAITLTARTAGEKYLRPATLEKQMAVNSFVAAQPGWSCFSWPDSGVLEEIEEKGLDDYTFRAGDVTITQTVEQTGYEALGGGLMALEGFPEDQLRCTLTFTLALDGAGE